MNGPDAYTKPAPSGLFHARKGARSLLAALLLFAALPASAACAPLFYGAVAADVLSTRYALNIGAAEANPLYGSNPSDGVLAAGAAARIAAGWYLERAGYDWGNCILAVMTWGVAGSNLAVARDGERLPYIGLGISIPLIWHGVRQ